MSSSISKTLVSLMLAFVIAVTTLVVAPAAQAKSSTWPTHTTVVTNEATFKKGHKPYYEIKVKAHDWTGKWVKGHASLYVNGKFERRRWNEWGWTTFRIDRSDLRNNGRNRIQVRVDPWSEKRKVTTVTRYTVDRKPAPKATSQRQRVVDAARSIVGRGYRFGEDGPRLFDCSGATKYAYAVVGVRIPHSSWSQSRLGKRVSSPLPGDLVWIPGHIAVYVGNGRIVEAASPRTGVREGPNWMRGAVYIRIL